MKFNPNCTMGDHDWEDIPPPPDEEKSPGRVCLRCDKVELTKKIKPIESREDKAKRLYSKFVHKRRLRNMKNGEVCGPGPYYVPPPNRIPDDD